MIKLKSPRTRHSLIALDVGHAGVRAVQLRRTGTQWSVIHASHIEDHAESRDAPGAAHDEGGTIARTQRWIKGCVARSEFHGKKASVALSSPDVEFHALELPEDLLREAQGDLSAIVDAEMQRLIPSAEQFGPAVHWRLPTTAMSAPNLIGATTRHEFLANILQACRTAHLDCVAVDAAAAALCRFGSVACGFDEQAIWGVLDLGYRQTRLVLCLGAIPILVRSVGCGGHGWTQQIADGLGITAKTAEIQKCDHGIRLPRDCGSSANPTTDRNELGSMLFGVLRRDLIAMTAEIKRSYEYALSCYAGSRAADLMLVGGGAALRHLSEFLSSELGIPVQGASSYLRQPECRFTYRATPSNPIEGYALALGLAVEE